jgi:hypothetical protein
MTIEKRKMQNASILILHFSFSISHFLLESHASGASLAVETACTFNARGKDGSFRRSAHQRLSSR